MITGASTGLGKSLAEILSSRAYSVYGTSRNPGSTEGLTYLMLPLDLADAEGIRAAVETVLEKEGRIDVLINNAGIGMAGPLEQVRIENVEKVFDTNVFGLLRVCQAVLPGMRRKGSGKIINISTIGSVVGLPYRGVYCASKSAVDMLSETMRLEVGPFGVEVCSVRAGDIRTSIADRRIMDYDAADPAYKETFERVAEAIDREVDQGMPPDEVAERVAQLLERQSLPPTLSVGKSIQRASIMAKRLLPARWFENIIKSYTKH